ncbi:pentapeptide repeat-containing protein [Roseiconus lacunae]|uniref:toll/interleukin-1 receptor domain-containing protein n=1 Tax=Roseiconus lacunae TaxID=2605694 RepID=UPI00308D3922|nr:pentapeptide repeat-containing protein [Stieleria sp. HD01]
MDRDEAIRLLRRGKEGVAEFNGRVRTTADYLILQDVDLSGADLSRVNLKHVTIFNVKLVRANLTGAKLSETMFGGADLSEAIFVEADLSRADLTGAMLGEANLTRANLAGANLSRAKLVGASLSKANLTGAILTKANLAKTCLFEADLIRADLSNANLCDANLRHVDMTEANLREADLFNADICRADMVRTILSGARLTASKLSNANMRFADLSQSELRNAYLNGVDLTGAVLRDADLSQADLTFAILHRARLDSSVVDDSRMHDAICNQTIFANVDLRGIQGIESTRHFGPSTIGVDTFEKSGWNIPDVFLRGCGVNEDFITYQRSFSPNPVEFFSCFISYSHADKSFARRLHDQLQARGIRCWLDEHAMLPGDDMYHAVDQGIKLWDKILFCASEASLESWWVERELDSAIAKEKKLRNERGKPVLAVIPLNLDDTLFDWDGPHSATITKRLAADFTGWESDNAKFESEFDKVVKALQTTREAPPESLL